MRIRTKVFMGVASVLVAVGAFFALNTQALSSYRDCEPDTIIKCGALSQSELLQHYDNNTGDVQHIYAHYGISRDDIAGKTSDIKVGTVYQDGRVVVDGKTVATNAYSVSRIAFTDKNGNKPRPVTINGTTLYEGPNMSIFLQSVDAFVYFRNGQFYKAILSACGNPLIATPEAQPIYTCDSLTATEGKIERTYDFKATATAKDGAQIVSYTYDFGDGNKQTTSSTTVSHQYAKAGTYTAKVSVNFKVGSSTQVISGNNCQKTITIKEKPVTPVYSCDRLTPRLITIKENTYEYTVAYTAKDGATFSKVAYDFGDGNKQATTATTVQHTYAKAGTYKVVATVYFSVKNGTATSEATKSCEATVKIVEKDMCPLPGKENYPKDSPECQPCPLNPSVPKDSPKCTPCPYNPELPQDSDKCVPPVTPPVTPPELPKTGLESFIGGGIGLGSIIAAGNYWFASRKNLLSTLLNK